MARRAGLAQSRPKIKAWLRRDVFLRDNFTCRLCGWRPAHVPEAYDGRATVRELVGTAKRKRWVHCLNDRRWIEVEIYRQLELDHIHPWSMAGPETADNLQTLCNTCNGSKGATL